MPSFDTSLTIAPSILDRLLDDDPRTASPFFSLSDFLNPPGLALKLRNQEDSISTLIREKCRSEIQNGIDAHDGTSVVPTDLQDGMLEGLNTLIDGDCIYEPERFQGISLSESTIKYIKFMEENNEMPGGESNEKPKGKNRKMPDGRPLMFLNRYLLEDAFPRHLRTRRVRETAYTLTELRRSVSRDLEALLNTRRELLDELRPEFKELQGSLLNYGLPDFTAMSLLSPTDRKKVRRVIEQTINTFEPRLRSVEVTVDIPEGYQQALHFRIEALLDIDPNPEPVTFDAVLQLSTAKYNVESQ